MKTYTLHTPSSDARAGVIEFPHTPQWEEVLNALLIRGDIIGLRRDVYECFYICQGESGSLHVVFRPEQRLAFRLIPQSR